MTTTSTTTPRMTTGMFPLVSSPGHAGVKVCSGLGSRVVQIRQPELFGSGGRLRVRLGFLAVSWRTHPLGSSARRVLSNQPEGVLLVP